METYSSISRTVENQLLRHELRSKVQGLIAEFQSKRLPELHGYLGHPEPTLVDYLISEQGMQAPKLSTKKKIQYSNEILDSFESCGSANPIHSLANPSKVVDSIALIHEFETENARNLSAFIGYGEGDKGLSVQDLMSQLYDNQVLFCHRVADRLDRVFWSLPSDIFVSATKIQSQSNLISGWKIKAWLTQREVVISECEAVLTTAFYDGLSKQDFNEGFSELGKANLGAALAHEIGRSAIPFESFDSLYGDEEDNVTGCLHVERLETQEDHRNQGYGRTLILGLGECLRNRNHFDVIVQAENGWKLDDHITYNPHLKSFHNSTVHAISASHVALTTFLDPVSVLMSHQMNSGKCRDGSVLNSAIDEGLQLKKKIMKTSRLCAQKGGRALGETWIFYPEWVPEQDFTTPAGEMA